MAYTNDPREFLIFGPDGQTWESDNRVEDRWKWNAQWLDLCGMSPEDYSKTIFIVSGATPATPSKSANTMTITTVGTTGGTYELEFSFAYAPTDDVNVSLAVNGKTVKETVPSGCQTYRTTNVGLAYPYATLTNISVSSNDESYTYKKVNNKVESGIFTVTYYLNDSVYTSYTEYIGTELPVPELEEKEGYTLNNWDVEYPVMPENGGEAYASYVINYYPLSINGVEKEQIAYGTLITLNDYVTDKEYLDSTKYAFEWQYSDGTPVGVSSIAMPVGGLSIYEHAEAKQYTITYVDYNGSVLTSATFGYKETITLPAPTPTREGYSFVKWDKTVPATMPNSNLVVKAVYKINQYTLTYQYTKEGETVVTTYTAITQNYATTISVADPHEVGYTFNGWTPEYATMPAKDDTVSTELMLRTDNVVYLKDNDGNVLPDGTYENVKAKETYSYDVTKAEREGYSINWNVESMNENGTFTVPCTDEPSIDIVATYTPKEYTVYVNGTPALDTVTYGTTINLNKYVTDEEYLDPSKYTFSWIDEDTSAKIENPTAYTVPAHDIKISEQAIPVEYELTFSGFKGAFISSADVAYNTYISGYTPTEPKEEGYTFTAWSGDPEYASDAKMPNHDVTYDAQFDINYHDLTIKYENGASALTDNIAYNTEVELNNYVPAIFATLSADSEDYALTWKDEAGSALTTTVFNMPDKDVVDNLEYILKIFRLTYHVMEVDGTEIESAAVSFYPQVTTEVPDYMRTASEIKGEEGWQLGEWKDKDGNDKPAVMPREDVDLYTTISKIPVTIEVVHKVEVSKDVWSATTVVTTSVTWGEAYTAPVPEYSAETHVLNWSVEPESQKSGLSGETLVPAYTTEKIIMTATVSLIPSLVFYGTYLDMKMTGNTEHGIDRTLYSIDDFIAFNSGHTYSYEIEGTDAKNVNLICEGDPTYLEIFDKPEEEQEALDEEWTATHHVDFLVFIPQGKTVEMKDQFEKTSPLHKSDLGTFVYDGGIYELYVQDGEDYAGIQYDTDMNFPMKITIK